MSKTTRELMQDRLKELTVQRDEILARSAPLRERRDKIVNDARAKELELNAQIKEVEKGLFELSNELGAVAMALGGLGMDAEPMR
jgi:uncharacterized coiled-coil DUF342 family protein